MIEKDSHLYALKIAPVSGELKARFEREVDALKTCSHSAISKIHASDLMIVQNREYWTIIEEYLPFGTLQDLTQSRSLSGADILHMGVSLAEALAHLFERKFVHRDIKPANILFRNSTEPVLTDFGIVRMLNKQSLTQDFMAQGPGTPMYAAPEQLLNEKSTIDWRTDQFGLALVLAEQLLGHHPFLTDENSQPRDAVMTVASRQSMPDINKQRLIDSGFGCLIKAMSPWSVQRYRKPEEFLNALKGNN
ncbi:hypothetical protein GCM10011396_51900 [Undibacterium terreum]|uniref:Protein kinase domain-containing protein n=1 Tax=Undibacterium terreum TaxID=1224302 RepID=A0A916V0A7_9BURK|nr:hypothetical protein GCM10011396_51900 [Undibacterium terreum]